MKKFMPIFIALIILAISYQLIVIFFIHGYTINYSVVGDDNLYDIKEVLYNNNKYDFYIDDKDGNRFLISDKFDFNKQKGVIKDIAYYKDKNVNCILPIYKRDRVGNIACLYEGGQVDYSYLMTNNVDTKKMVSKFKKYGYNIDKSYDLNDHTDEYQLINEFTAYVYTNNLYEGYTFIMWNYDGIFFINKDKIVQKQYLDEDLYDNSNSRIVGKYYMIFKFSDIYKTLNDVFFVNLEDYGKNSVYIKNNLNNNMYINGVYDNKLYITDLKAKIQYALNPYKANFEVVGEDKEFTILKNNQLEKISSKYYFRAKYYFDVITVDNITKKFGNINVYQSGNYYYFMKDNIFYKQHKDYPVSIKLFEFKDVSDWRLADGDIVFISGDTMYFFSEKYGIKPIVKNKEFKFNYNNICNLYKKS